MAKTAKKKATKKKAAKKKTPGKVSLNREAASGCITNTDAMAHILGLSKDAVRKHLRENEAPKVATGKLRLAEFVQWYCARIRDGSDETKKEKQRLAVTQRRRAELELQQKRGEMYDKTIVKESILTLATIVATRLDSLAARVSGQAVTITDTAKMQEYLINETRAIRTEIARQVESFAGDIGSVENNQSTTANERG